MSRIMNLEQLNTAPIQGVRAGQGQKGQDDALMREFTEILDKIAAKLAHPHTGSTQDILIGAPVEPVRVKPQPAEKKKEKPEEEKVEADSKNDGDAVVLKQPQQAEEDEEVSETSTAPAREAAEEDGEVSETSVASEEDQEATQPTEEVVEEVSEVTDDIEEVVEFRETTETTEDTESTEDEALEINQKLVAQAEAKPEKIKEVKPEVEAADVEEQPQPELGKRPTIDVEARRQQEFLKKHDISPQELKQAVDMVSEHAPELPVTLQELAARLNAQVDRMEDAAAEKGLLHKLMAAAGELDGGMMELFRQVLDVSQQDILAVPMVLRRALEGSPVTGRELGQTLAKVEASSSALNLGASNTSSDSGVSNNNLEHTSRSRSLSKPLASRTMKRVEEALKEAARSKDGKTISLRLDPPSLGRVKVDVTLRDNVLHARIVADQAAVTQMLRERSHELQVLLRRIGLNADQVSVSVGGGHTQGQEDFHAMFSEGRDFSRDERSLDDQHQVEGSDVAAMESQKVATPVDHWIA